VQPDLKRPHHQHLQSNAPAPQLLRQLKKAFLDGLKTCLAANLPTNLPNPPQKTNRLAQASAAKVDLAKAATGTTAVVVNAVVKVVAQAQKAGLAKAAMTAPTKPRPIPPAATALKVDVKVDADVAEAIVQTDGVAKKLGPQKSQPTPWQAMWQSTPAKPANAHRGKKLTDAVVVAVVVNATTQAQPTRKCHWQKMRLPALQMVLSRKLWPTLLPRQAKAASVSMSAVNDATVTAMAAIVRHAQKNPKMPTQRLWITLGHPQHLRLSQWQPLHRQHSSTACPASPLTNCPWASYSKSPLAAVWSG
jgi:hypothetical protein